MTQTAGQWQEELDSVTLSAFASFAELAEISLSFHKEPHVKSLQPNLAWAPPK